MTKIDGADFFVLRIPQDSHGHRLDKVLAQHPLIGSRSKAVQLIEDGRVLGPKKIKASSSALEGEEYKVTLPPPEESQLLPMEMSLDIVHEDEDLLVVNKPGGLVVHPAAGHAQDTLVNALIHKVGNFSMGFGDKRPGIVHRLDKDTSGLLVVAKNDFTQNGLVQQFKDRSVKRLYKAIVLGRPQRDGGTIESYLLRHPTQRKKFASVKGGGTDRGKKAITDYSLIRHYNMEVSLMECRLKTGRTHQIRVHMSEFGHPIVGDPIYGSRMRENKIRKLSLRKQIAELARIGLHAAELGFVHPRSGENLFFTAPWPEDLHPLLNELGWLDVE